MKKIIFILVLFIFSCLTITAQTFETNYVKGKNSTYCGEESFSFEFQELVFIRIDNDSGNRLAGPSKILQTNYDDNGNYFQIRSPKYILDDYGVNAYKKYEHYLHKIIYDKKGGDILYVYELNSDDNSVKYYITEKGYSVFCNQ